LNLDSNLTHAHAALSYVWGDPCVIEEVMHGEILEAVRDCGAEITEIEIR
jgi:hypothetical protein